MSREQKIRADYPSRLFDDLDCSYEHIFHLLKEVDGTGKSWRFLLDDILKTRSIEMMRNGMARDVIQSFCMFRSFLERKSFNQYSSLSSLADALSEVQEYRRYKLDCLAMRVSYFSDRNMTLMSFKSFRLAKMYGSAFLCTSQQAGIFNSYADTGTLVGFQFRTWGGQIFCSHRTAEIMRNDNQPLSLHELQEVVEVLPDISRYVYSHADAMAQSRHAIRMEKDIRRHTSFATANDSIRKKNRDTLMRCFADIDNLPFVKGVTIIGRSCAMTIRPGFSVNDMKALYEKMARSISERLYTTIQMPCPEFSITLMEGYVEIMKTLLIWLAETVTVDSGKDEYDPAMAILLSVSGVILGWEEDVRRRFVIDISSEMAWNEYFPSFILVNILGDNDFGWAERVLGIAPEDFKISSSANFKACLDYKRENGVGVATSRVLGRILNVKGVSKEIVRDIVRALPVKDILEFCFHQNVDDTKEVIELYAPGPDDAQPFMIVLMLEIMSPYMFKEFRSGFDISSAYYSHPLIQDVLAIKEYTSIDVIAQYDGISGLLRRVRRVMTYLERFGSLCAPESRYSNAYQALCRDINGAEIKMKMSPDYHAA